MFLLFPFMDIYYYITVSVAIAGASRSKLGDTVT